MDMELCIIRDTAATEAIDKDTVPTSDPPSKLGEMLGGTLARGPLSPSARAAVPSVPASSSQTLGGLQDAREATRHRRLLESLSKPRHSCGNHDVLRNRTRSRHPVRVRAGVMTDERGKT